MKFKIFNDIETKKAFYYTLLTAFIMGGYTGIMARHILPLFDISETTFITIIAGGWLASGFIIGLYLRPFFDSHKVSEIT